MGAATDGLCLLGQGAQPQPGEPERFNPCNRFVLSAGPRLHVALSLLHLTGYKERRPRRPQANSAVGLQGRRGHPENLRDPGREVTTGPARLRAFANAVGLAIAEATPCRKFNRAGSILVDHFTT